MISVSVKLDECDEEPSLDSSIYRDSLSSRLVDYVVRELVEDWQQRDDYHNNINPLVSTVGSERST